MSADTTVILILGVLNSAAFVALVAAVVGGLRGLLDKHFGESRVTAATKIARDAAQAVEQLTRAQGLAPEAKFAEALARARALGAANGIVLTDTQWETLIESAVHTIREAGTVFLPVQEVSGDGGGSALPAADTVLKLDTTQG